MTNYIPVKELQVWLRLILKIFMRLKSISLRTLKLLERQIFILKDVDLGNFNTLKLQADEVEKPSRLYHILTDTGFFNIDGHKIKRL